MPSQIVFWPLFHHNICMKRKTNNLNKTLIVYKFVGYPNEEQKVLLAKTFGCVRYLWNRMLSDRIELYKEMEVFVNNTSADYKDLEECLWLNEVDSLALSNMSLNLDKAFTDFFKGKTNFPKFKSKKKQRDSYTTNNVNNNIRLSVSKKTGLLKLPKLGEIKLFVHRKIKPGGKLKSVTVRYLPDGKYTFSLLYAYDTAPVAHEIDSKKEIGLDMSVPKLYIDSNGNEPDFPKPYRTMQERISKEQRKLSRMKYRSNNYEKQRLKLNCLHSKIKNQRLDFLHKQSTQLIEQYYIIGLENINLQSMSRALNFGKSISDNGFGMFREMLKYKAELKGKKVIVIDKWFSSSKTCHNCGYVNKELKLSDREYICPICGEVFDRDVNAAINIKEEAVRIYLSE